VLSAFARLGAEDFFWDLVDDPLVDRLSSLLSAPIPGDAWEPVPADLAAGLTMVRSGHARGRLPVLEQRFKDGAKPVLFRGWASLAEAFITRQVDVVHLLMPLAVQLRYSVGSAARVLGWNHTNGSALTVAPHVTDLSQLAGQQVAIPFWWSIHNIVIQRMFRAHGLRPVIRQAASRSANTVELIVMSPSDMIPALASGSIAAYTVADPFNAAAEVSGIGRIHGFLGDVWRDHACCALLVHEDLIEKSPTAVQSLTDSVVAAQLRIDSDRKSAAALRHRDWEPQRIGFQPFPFPSFTAALIEAMHDTVVDGDRTFLSRLDPATVHSELVDDRFVRNALSTRGGPQAFGLPHNLSRTEEVDPT
jgi:NitT/TauT family transport system substrate-binding protein